MSKLVTALQLSFRAAAAAALALAIAALLQLEFPIYAMIAAVIATDLSPVESRKLGLRRLAGTVVGSLVGAVLSALLPGGVATIALGVFLAMFICHLLRLAEAAKIAGYVCAIVLLEHAVNPWLYALWRFTETVIGIGVAFGVSLLPRMLGGSPPASPRR